MFDASWLEWVTLHHPSGWRASCSGATPQTAVASKPSSGAGATAEPVPQLAAALRAMAALRLALHEVPASQLALARGECAALARALDAQGGGRA